MRSGKLIIHCSVTKECYPCGEECVECLCYLMGAHGTINVDDINEFIHADSEDEFEFTPSEGEPKPVFLMKNLLLFKMPIFGE